MVQRKFFLSLLTLGVVFAAFGPLMARQASSRSKQKTSEPKSLWPWKWPFKENEKIVGVEWHPRHVKVSDAEIREWRCPRHAAGYDPNIGQLSFTYLDEPVKAKLVELTAEWVGVLEAGKNEPESFWKRELCRADQEYCEGVRDQACEQDRSARGG